jgi:hypothetical protein
MAREDQLAWPALTEITAAASTFLDPVLAGELDAQWEPTSWAWREAGRLHHHDEAVAIPDGSGREKKPSRRKR